MNLINGVREQVGSKAWTLNNSAIKFAKDIASEYEKANRDTNSGHYVEGINKAAEKNGLIHNQNYNMYENMGGFSTQYIPTHSDNEHDLKQQLDDDHLDGKKVTMDNVKWGIYDGLKAMLFSDDEWEHMASLTGAFERSDHEKNRTESFGLSFSATPNPNEDGDFVISTHYTIVNPDEVQDPTKFNTNDNIQFDNFAQLNTKLDQAKADKQTTAKALDDATSAADKADKALQAAQDAKTHADQQVADANVVKENADKALDAANAGASSAAQKLTEANNAKAAAQEALSQYQSQLADKQKALNDAKAAQQTEENKLAPLSEALSNAKSATATAQTAKNAADQAVKDAQTKLDKANDAVTKAQQTLDDLNNAQDNFANANKAWQNAQEALSTAHKARAAAEKTLFDAKSNVAKAAKKLADAKDATAKAQKAYDEEQARNNASQIVDDTINAINRQAQEQPVNATVYLPVINNNRNWKIRVMDDQGHYLDKYIATDQTINILAQKTVNGQTYYKIGNGKWVPARYVQNMTEATREKSIRGVAYMPRLAMHPTWKVAMLDANGHWTGKYLSTNTSWKVFGVKVIRGILCYRLGTQEQWVPAQYLRLR